MSIPSLKSVNAIGDMRRATDLSWRRSTMELQGRVSRDLMVKIHGGSQWPRMIMSIHGSRKSLQMIETAIGFLLRSIQRFWAAGMMREIPDRVSGDNLSTLLPKVVSARPLDTLPYDILLTICRHVPSPQDLSHLSLACRALTHPAQYALFQHLPPLDPWDTVLAFSALLHKPYLARTVKSVKLKVCEADELQRAKGYGLQPAAWLRLVWRAIRGMPGLQELELVAEKRKNPGVDLPRIWAMVNLLSSDLRLKRVHLSLPVSDPVDFLVQQTVLEELVLIWQYSYGGHTSTHWLARLTCTDLPALKVLDAPGLWAVKHILFGRPVERLRINDWLMPQQMPELGPILLPTASRLRVLELSYLFIMPEVIQWFAENLTGLEELRLKIWVEVDEPLSASLRAPGVLQSMRHLKKLRKLTFDLVEKHSSGDRRELSRLVHLLGNSCEALDEIEVNTARKPFHCRRSKLEGSKKWGRWMIRS